MKNKPEIIVYISLVIFFSSLFMNSEKVKATLQVSSMVISGYFGFINQKDE